MKTNRFCPHCGRPVLKSGLKQYAFQCYGCDEDFYRVEVLRKNDKERIVELRKSCIETEFTQGNHHYSVYKPYPRTKQ